MSNVFREKIENTDDFVISFELVPGRTMNGKNIQNALEFARQAAEDKQLDALTITDNPSGNPSLSPDDLGREMKQIGIDPMVHFACRDWNRSGAFSRALQLNRMGIENVLALSGDYSGQSEIGTAKPCFDLDSTTLVHMLDGMNRNVKLPSKKTPPPPPEPTNFFIGAAVSCYKHSENEVMTQYYKLLKKIHNGANFIVTQLCYDARKFQELLMFLKQNNCDIPVLGSVYILSAPAARFMNKGNVPGIHVSDKLLDQVQAEAKMADKGRSAYLERAAKMVAILKGLGYRGAHLAGMAKYPEIKGVIARFNEIKDNWKEFLVEFDFPYAGGFYLYEKDEATGLNTDIDVKKAPKRLGARLKMAQMSVFHNLMFEPKAKHFGLLKGIAKLVDKSCILKKMYCLGEDVSKSMIFNCQHCGDCALVDMAYICPQSQCPKYMRNGPCGGSEMKMCEVRKENQCAWVRVYERLKIKGTTESLKCNCIPPRNWALDKTSSWLNFYLGLDHSASEVPHCQRKPE